ncbi:uncharacterized protein LOC121360043 [Pyrgilauda ruficollis]|uniref:uncharacterized protein LOC121360043 n=1 Tax=Pyrgilauda ruficollis TaxID=221976 RepID=UPI001B864D3F|nr:uncharacterized protein LOC121360043 [Pyrgilauda ruficollis]
MWSALCVGFLPIVAVTGQVALEQLPTEVTVREGSAVTFHCSMKGGYMSSYYMYWYRQVPQGSLEWIYNEGDLYGEGFQDRFKARVESSQNSFTLQILAAKPGDAATYYCGARITLEQLCSRMNQKPADGEDRSLSISFWQLLPRALVGPSGIDFFSVDPCRFSQRSCYDMGYFFHETTVPVRNRLQHELYMESQTCSGHIQLLLCGELFGL